MSRKGKYSKETKVKACKDYIAGKGSFKSISKSVGCDKSSLSDWYHRYIQHGEKVFEITKRNKSYSKEFKLFVVKKYIDGKFSAMDLSVKYDIHVSIIKNWINKYYNGIELKDYDPKGDVYTMESRKTTYKERLEIVKWVINNDMNYKEAADKHAIKYSSVYKWTKMYLNKGPESLKYGKRGPKSKTDIKEDELTENQKLKLELERERAKNKRLAFELEVHKKKEEFQKERESRE
ncbi:helix-turn-helix domain-containing protein [Oceanotoga teriensis]|jgi:transposase-like protein|uniref:Transposase-like protein n=1 Tax=Oceanotoga teriensis TaxID=515440 RepID=A0AA45C888_9BACT|nr:helix-turn-helix domain-containing protein [Oceanotoga teriensis]MDO7976385.1 transposase [Oceanotoga teriensis]PWJ95940.1 transposase-like protein [Oceanotoga teriensis]